MSPAALFRRRDIEVLESRIAPAAIANLDLSSLTGSNGFSLSGVAANDRSGFSVSDAGDVNGDGFDDVIVGANLADPNGLSSGSSYVVFGQATGFPATVELSSLNGTTGFKLNGLATADNSGAAVSAAGDVNGDGFDDLIIGAFGGDPHDAESGISYVVFGRASFAATAGTLELSSLNGTTGFTISGVAGGDAAGRAVGGAGDVNGDGFDDLIIGAATADPNGADSGAAYVVFGRGGTFATNVDLSSLTGTDGFRLAGVALDDRAGFSVGTAGDVNGDGFDDLIVGASRADPNGSISGASYVVFGRANGFTANLNLSALTGTNGFKISGVAADDYSGGSVHAAGDINGDGFDDVIIGAKFADPNGSLSGASYVVFGQAAPFAANLDLSALTGTNGFKISGVAAFNYSGVSVSAAGDVNGDGFNDVIIGAFGTNSHGTFSGASYVVFGQAAAFGASLDLSSLTGTNGFKISGVATDDRAGGAVSAAGDVNGDGFDDVIIGALGADPHGSYSGASYVVFGFDTGAVTHPGTSAGETLTGTAGANVIIGGQAGDTLVGGGGADVLRGGEGADVLAVSDLNFIRLAGGNGADKLRLDGSGLALDLTTLPDSRITGIEQIDIRGSGANTLSLNLQEVLNLSEESNTLLVRNDAADTVAFGTGWAAGGTETIAGVTYTVFTQGAASLKLENFSPFIAIADASILEGDTGTTSLIFTLTRGSADLNTTATVDFTTASGTATTGQDFTAKSGTVTFGPGITTRTVTINVTGETAIEPDETFFVNLSNASGATLADTQAIGTILNDDAPPSFTIADAGILEGNTGTTSLIFTVTLGDADPNATTTVDFATTNGTATSGQDYTAKTGTLTFAPGITTRTITIDVTGETSIEPNETFFLNLSNATGATLADAQAVGTILNDDATSLLTIADASIAEGNSGTPALVFTVTRAGGDLSGTTTVDFATASGTATSGVDFVAKTGTLSFGPNVTTRTITIDLSGETAVEADETFFINLTNPSGATLSDAQAVGTILNDDVTLRVSADRKTATFLDVDGDTVTVKAGKPVLDAADFTFRQLTDAIGGVQVEKLDLRDIGIPGSGTTLTITAKRGPLGGDGLVNIGAIDATGVNLGAVSIAGDLGQIDAGSGALLPPAIASLTVGSIGGFGLSTQNPATASLQSEISGAVGALVVKSDLNGATINVTGGASGRIASVLIGRSIIGGDTSLSGSITASGAIGPVTIRGNLLGGVGSDSATLHGAKITSVALGGSLLAGAGPGSAVIAGDTAVGAVSVKHDIRGGAIMSGGTLGPVSIVGDLVGALGDFSGSIVATGAITSVTIGGSVSTTDVGRSGILSGATLGPVKIGGSVDAARITSGGDSKGLTVGGSVRSSEVLAGFTTAGAPLTSDAQLGAIVVKGDWIASAAAAGIDPGADGFGTSDDAVIAGTNAAKFSRIVSIAIGGEARGTDGGADSFAFTAEQIGSLKVGKTVFPLVASATAEDELFVGPTFDLRARELDATTPAAPAPTPTITASTLAFSLDFKTATFTDVDGDRVTVRTDTGKFDVDNFTLAAGSNGGAIFQTLNLANDPDFVGKKASLTISAVRSAGQGDGWVDVGAIDASGVDLVRVIVGGDLGQIDAGNSDSATPALASIAVHSLGGRGVSTQAGAGSTHSELLGRVGALSVATNLDGAAFTVDGGATAANGSLGSAIVGGSVIGGGAEQVAEIVTSGNLTTAIVKGDIRGGSVLHSGRIRAGGKIGTILVSGSLVGGTAQDTGNVDGETGIGLATVTRSLIGGSGESSGSLLTRSGNLTSAKVGGDLLGGAGDESGSISAGGAGDLGAIGAVTIGGSVFATTGAKGGILSDSTLGTVIIAGDVRGLGTTKVILSAEGIATPATLAKALAIKSLTIGGSVALADILAGYDRTQTLTNADVQIGAVTVKGVWSASNLLAGVSLAGTLFSGGEQAIIAARIASIVIGGGVLGTPAMGDSFAFSAQQIGSMKIGLTTLPLTPATNDLPIGATDDVRVREIA